MNPKFGAFLEVCLAVAVLALTYDATSIIHSAPLRVSLYLVGFVAASLLLFFAITLWRMEE